MRCYVARYGFDTLDTVENGAMTYGISGVWDLAYDALLQGKQLEFYCNDPDAAPPHIGYRYV